MPRAPWSRCRVVEHMRAGRLRLPFQPEPADIGQSLCLRPASAAEPHRLRRRLSALRPKRGCLDMPACRGDPARTPTVAFSGCAGLAIAYLRIGHPSRGSGRCDIHHDALGSRRRRWRSEQRGAESAVRRHNASPRCASPAQPAAVVRKPNEGHSPAPGGAGTSRQVRRSIEKRPDSPTPVVRRHRTRWPALFSTPSTPENAGSSVNGYKAAALGRGFSTPVDAVDPRSTRLATKSERRIEHDDAETRPGRSR
jgi:hypothetical protein